MELDQAALLAEEALTELRPYCIRIEVAGGVRRRKPDPHDVELVCIPVTEPKGEDLFGNPLADPELAYQDALFDTLSTSLVAYGENDYSMTQGPPDKAGKKAPCGPRYYRLMYKGQRLDVFAVLPPAQWGVVMTLRTGDAGFSHWLVQQGYRRGIHTIDGHLEVVRDERGYLVTRPFDHDKIPREWRRELLQTPEETDVFHELGVFWKDPVQRVTEQEFQTW